MTNKEAIEKWGAVQYLKTSGVSLSEKVNYARFRNEKTIKPIIEAYEETRLAIIEQNCRLSSNEDEAAKGIYEVPKNGSKERSAYDSALKTLDQMEAMRDEDFHWIGYDQVQSISESDPMLYSALMELVKE